MRVGALFRVRSRHRRERFQSTCYRLQTSSVPVPESSAPNKTTATGKATEAPKETPPMTKSVDFYFDFGSPAAYLAATQLPHVCADTGAELVWKPMLLGGVFQA